MLIKKLTILFLLTNLVMSCKKVANEIVPQKLRINKPTIEKIAKDDTIYIDSTMIVIKSQKSTDTLFKFHSELDNKKFQVKVKNLKLNKELDFNYYQHKKKFITIINKGVKDEGVNFAGTFCFVSWGCGSPCQMSAVVDMETGIVYDGLPSAVGYKFNSNSKLLIVNPPDSTNYYPKNRWVNYPSQYIWNGKKFIEINTIKN